LRQKGVKNLERQYIDGSMLKKMFINAANTLSNNKDTVDALNVFPVPDGDTGTNMSLTLYSAVDELHRLKDETAGSVAEAVANGSLMGARGNSGVILSQLFRGFAARLKGKKNVDTDLFAKALSEGVETAYKAVMRPTEGTILTVAREMAAKAIEIAGSVDLFDRFIEQIMAQANDTLERTPQMLDVLAQAGVVDAGGKGLVYIVLGFLTAIKGEDIHPIEQKPVISDKGARVIEEFDIRFPYCTEFIIMEPSGTPDGLKAAISHLGDSMLVVGDNKVIKLHIHTANPGKVIEEALKLGQLSRIKVENMKEQHRSIIEKEINDVLTGKEYGIISIAMGQGFEELFKDLGVDVVIQGGQTMNPSTQDILKAIEELNAKNIIILPNNGNVIMAANQAKDLSNKSVYVIPSKSMPQGISAMVAFNGMKAVDDNYDDMVKNLESVKTGQVTYAVRDSVFDGFEIEEGDIIGIGEGSIRVKGKSAEEVAYDLVISMADQDSEIITIFYGQDVNAEAAELLAERLEQEFGDCEIELHPGGQPVYYYIVAVE
jgi:DAK2 domain fusion protein YloV